MIEILLYPLQLVLDVLYALLGERGGRLFLALGLAATAYWIGLQNGCCGGCGPDDDDPVPDFVPDDLLDGEKVA